MSAPKQVKKVNEKVSMYADTKIIIQYHLRPLVQEFNKLVDEVERLKRENERLSNEINKIKDPFEFD